MNPEKKTNIDDWSAREKYEAVPAVARALPSPTLVTPPIDESAYRESFECDRAPTVREATLRYLAVWGDSEARITHLPEKGAEMCVNALGSLIEVEVTYVPARRSSFGSWTSSHPTLSLAVRTDSRRIPLGEVKLKESGDEPLDHILAEFLRSRMDMCIRVIGVLTEENPRAEVDLRYEALLIERVAVGLGLLGLPREYMRALDSDNSSKLNTGDKSMTGSAVEKRSAGQDMREINVALYRLFSTVSPITQYRSVVDAWLKSLGSMDRDSVIVKSVIACVSIGAIPFLLAQCISPMDRWLWAHRLERALRSNKDRGITLAHVLGTLDTLQKSCWLDPERYVDGKFRRPEARRIVDVACMMLNLVPPDQFLEALRMIQREGKLSSISLFTMVTSLVRRMARV